MARIATRSPSGVFPRTVRNSMTAQMMAGLLLAYVIYPLWIAAGAADLYCHRRTRLAVTSGVIESALHLLQLSLIGAATLLVIFIEVTKVTLLILAILVALHSYVSFRDVAYTDQRRRITPFEQHVHAYLEVLPSAALLALAVAEWPTITASALELRLRSPGWPAQRVIAIITPALLFACMPALLEFRQHFLNSVVNCYCFLIPVSLLLG